MADERFLIVRLSSLGDVIFTLPVLAALRDSFPRAYIGWVIDQRWQALLEENPDLNDLIPLRGRSIGQFLACGRRLRDFQATCVLDVQGLYKSALLARLSRAPRRIGFTFARAREGGASLFYTERILPHAAHMVDQNLELAAAAGAKVQLPRLPLRVQGASQTIVDQLLLTANIARYVVLSPGGGWKSKCWPPDRFGELALRIWNTHGLRIIINCGPGEMQLAEIAAAKAGAALPIIVQYELPELMALLHGAELVVAADTGPLHLASALGTPVVGLYGPTSPARNGPYGKQDIVVRNASDSETTYKRGSAFSETMLSISVDQVTAAVQERLANRQSGRLDGRLVDRLGNRVTQESGQGWRPADGKPLGPAQ
jgi:heptosyltransferase-1